MRSASSITCEPITLRARVVSSLARSCMFRRQSSSSRLAMVMWRAPRLPPVVLPNTKQIDDSGPGDPHDSKLAAGDVGPPAHRTFNQPAVGQPHENLHVEDPACEKRPVERAFDERGPEQLGPALTVV